MANIAPMIASPQPAPQSPAQTGKSTRSESSFGTILDTTVASSRKTTSQKTTANPNTSEKKTATSDQTPLVSRDGAGTPQTPVDAEAVLSDGDASSPADTNTPLQSEIFPGKATDGLQDPVFSQAYDVSENIVSLFPSDSTAAPRNHDLTTAPFTSATIDLAVDTEIQASQFAIDRAAITSTPEPPPGPIASETAPTTIRPETTPSGIFPDLPAIAVTPQIAKESILPDTKPIASTAGASTAGIADAITVSPSITFKDTDTAPWARPASMPLTSATWTLSPTSSGNTVPLGEYTATVGTNSIPTVQGNEAAISSQLQELISTNDKSVVTINRQPAAAVTLANLETLTPSLQLSAVTTNPAIQAQSGSPSENATVLAATFNQLISLKTPVSDATEKPSPAEIKPLRQDIRGQFIEAKIEAQDKGSNSQNQQSTRQEMTTSTQVLTSQTSATPAVDQTVTFSQVSQGVLNQALPQNAAIPTQPAAPPPGAPRYDESVLNQVAERFQFNTRNQETQLNIKLHPAELGELKIGLTMKDGSIRAHVVAQSGRIQEILERNMPRLRGMLESQGFTIEEILVSAKSDDVGNFDLLQDHSSKQNTAGQQGSQNTDTHFNETFDSVITAAGIPTTSVNITA